MKQPTPRLWRRTHLALLCVAWPCLAVGAEKPLIHNASFEDVVKLNAPPKGNAFGRWAIKGLRAPARWRLNPAFPGELEVVEGGAADGARFLRVKAMPRRACHLAQSCPWMRRGMAYEISLRYRGGPVELRVYEYNAKGRLKADRAFAAGPPTPTRSGPWGRLKGVYKMPVSIAKVTLVLAAPAGADADLDDVRAARLKRSEKWINARDFGASGSEYETVGRTTAGSSVVVLDEIGDFQVGQQVAVSKCNPHVCDGRVWGRPRDKTGETYFKEEVRARGYDSSKGDWTVFVLDFAGTDPPAFRWSDDLGLTWSKPARVTGDWQKLSAGVEVKFLHPGFWIRPAVVSFSGRGQLVSTILAVRGDRITLADPAPVSAKGCVVQHTDTAPLQRAFDRAVGEGRNLFIPAGRYRLTAGLKLTNADGITIEGENEQTAILDIRNGSGACIDVRGGTSVTIRKLRFEGFSGFAERRQMGHMRTRGYAHMWGFFVKFCAALWIHTPQRILVDNCHAVGMSGECFYSASRGRTGNSDPAHYTQSIVYQYCTVTDCARNAFNNNDHAENTAVLYCRVQDVGGCSWEGASRYVKIVGNYFRNAGTVAIGNTRSRSASFDVLPTGQHIVAHNTFEQEMAYGGCAVRSSAGATPVLICDNLFINFNTSAIQADSYGDARHLPSANTLVTGNAIDLTCVRGASRPRFGVSISADHATISDNQIYVRGPADPRVKGIVLAEPARDLIVHDNLIYGCGAGLAAEKQVTSIVEVLNPRAFRGGRGIAWPRRRTSCYRGYRLVWMRRRNRAALGPRLDAFDPEACVFRLAKDADLQRGKRFALCAPQGFNWSIHHNVIHDCLQPVRLDVFGGPTAVFADNILSRGTVEGVKAAADVRGVFKIADNQFAGFDEPGSAALVLHPDPLRRGCRTICRDNVFVRCATPIAATAPGVWKAVIKGGNVFGERVEAAAERTARPRVAVRAAPARRAPVCRAKRVAVAPVIDGRLDDWDWGENAGVFRLTRTHVGQPSRTFTARGRAAYDAHALYLALDIALPPGEKFDPQNGVEWSLASADEKQYTPIYVLWCKADGSFDSLTAMGAGARDAARLKTGVRYAVARTNKGWACEWRVPWAALGVSSANPPRVWLMNLGVHSMVSDTWLVWTPTGGRVCEVDKAGELWLGYSFALLR